MITIELLVDAPPEKVWNCFTGPEHIVNWNFASPEWHCPSAKNKLEPGGEFSYRMAARDGSFAFDLNGTFTQIEANQFLAYHLEDGRKVEVHFKQLPDGVQVIQKFEPEKIHSEELQQQGWQAILNEFGRYVATVQ